MSESVAEAIPVPYADTSSGQLRPPKYSQALAALAANPAWELDAGCKDVDASLFFPYGDTADSEEFVSKADIDAAERAAMKEVVPICGSCAVRFACIGYALKYSSVGIYGAATTDYRRGMAKNAQVLLRVRRQRQQQTSAS
jgi:hypothetical protein